MGENRAELADDETLVMHDSGSDGNVTGHACVLVPDEPVVRIDVDVVGINGENLTGGLKATHRGKFDVVVGMSDGKHLVKRVDMLVVPGISLISDEEKFHEPASLSDRPVVLLGTSKFAKDAEMGIYFAPGGEEVEMYEGGRRVKSFSTEVEGLYVTRQKVNPEKKILMDSIKRVMPTRTRQSAKKEKEK